ncbi:MAG: glycosyltransferase family 4 protein [Melioribacteraceae bacterium]|nr:glycosyltransferase family 4 protein [Melioribacteraceae bacterium]
MKKIAINLLPYSPGMQGGSEVYIRNILNSIKTENLNYKIYLFISEDIKGLYTNRNNIEFEEVVILKGGCSRLKRIFYEQFVLPYHLYKYKIDLVISNYVVPVFSTCMTLGIIHDMQYKRMPELFEKSKLIYWNLFIPLTIWRSKLIGTISNFSKNELIEFFPKVKKKVFITSEGIKPEIQTVVRSLKKTEFKNINFILSVATFGKHKNLITLIKSMKFVVEKFPDIKLKLVGAARTPDAISARDKLKLEINNLGLTDNIEFLGFVSDEHLGELYSRCLAYVFPSLYEGFGLPLIEAQSCGAPVIISNKGSLPEVGEKGSLIFNALDEKDLSKKILHVIENPQFRKEMIEQGYDNIKRYSWEKGAHDLINAINKIEF